MPTVDLNAVLGPIVQSVRDTFFPDLISIDGYLESRDVKGQPTGTFGELEAAVPAVVSKAQGTGLERGGEVITNEQRLKVLLEGVHVVPLDGRIRRTSAAGVAASDAWDVVGVTNDPVRVTTSIVVRLTQPPRAT